MKKILAACFIICSLNYQMHPASLFQTFHSTQLIIVTAETDTSTTGTLSFFKYNIRTGKWIKKFDSIPVNVGRTGFAWGEGLHHVNTQHDLMKQEGDGKSPAGIFYLRTAFGYAAPSLFPNKSYAYKQVTSNTLCVDDARSAYYNRLIDTPIINAKTDWESAEVMQRHDDLYKWGIFVGYNDSPAKKGNGSCIFFHVWKGFNSPTSGCTSLAEENLVRLLKELKTSAKPIVIQGSREQVEQLRKLYRIP